MAAVRAVDQVIAFQQRHGGDHRTFLADTDVHRSVYLAFTIELQHFLLKSANQMHVIQ